MASYVVMEPPARSEEDRAVLVRDGFHVLALLLPAIWLLFHRLWLEAAIFIAVAVLLSLLGNAAGFGMASTVLSIVIAVFVGMEGAALRIAAMRRRGWREWGVVEADNPRDAEIRYLTRALDGEPDEPPAPPAPARPALRPRHASASALGMVGYSGRN